MAINIPIISSFDDKGIAAAKAAFNNFKSAVGDAEGGMNKFKAGSTAALDAVKANAGAFAIAGAAAFVKFAISGIDAFQKLALSAKKFSDATGLAVKDASRYMEAAGDIGVPVEALTTAIGKLNKTIGMDANKVRDLGVDLVYLDNGALDVNETFLNTIERIKGIKDPAEKAKIATQLLGKGWQGMSELIAMGADDLKKSLASVDDSKIIDKDEVKKAEDYRAAMDTLRDSFEKMAINLGERLIPKVADLLELLAKLPEALRGSGGVVEDVFSTEELAMFGNEAAIARVEFERMAKLYVPYIQSRISFIKETTGAIDEQGDEVVETDEAWKGLIGTLEIERAMMGARDQLDQLKETALEAYNGSEEAVNEYKSAVIDAQLMVLRLAEDISLTASQQDYIRVLVDTGEIERALDLLDRVRAGGTKLGIEEQRFAGRRAAGGPVSPGGSYLVGERGPELFTPTSSGNITPNQAMGGGNTITVNVNGGDPDSVVRAIQQWSRDNGAVPIRTTMTRTG
jgi:hypothetical protein